MTLEADRALRFVFDFGGVLFNWRPIDLVQRHFPQQASDQASARATVAAVFQGFGSEHQGVVSAGERWSPSSPTWGICKQSNRRP